MRCTKGSGASLPRAVLFTTTQVALSHKIENSNPPSPGSAQPYTRHNQDLSPQPMP